MATKSGGTKNSKTNEAKNKSSSCPMDYVFYATCVVFVGLYVGYLYDQPHFKSYSGLKPLARMFEFVEQYSPFQEFLDDDHQVSTSGERLLTHEELKQYDGSEGSPGIYLALLGQVFDVSKSPDYYGPKGGYGFFSGRDGSRAFVTGEFNEQGLTDDVDGLSNGDYQGLEDWMAFYHKDYTYVGKLIGRYYNKDGSTTEYWSKIQKKLHEAQREAEAKQSENQIFPPCNSEWSASKGHRVWCTKKSGGINRDWIGVPRQLFYPGRKERCACIKDKGKSLFEPTSNSNNNGDLSNPYIKAYKQCENTPQDSSCQISPPEEDEI